MFIIFDIQEYRSRHLSLDTNILQRLGILQLDVNVAACVWPVWLVLRSVRRRHAAFRNGRANNAFFYTFHFVACLSLMEHVLQMAVSCTMRH